MYRSERVWSDFIIIIIIFLLRTDNIDFTNIPQERKQSNLYVASNNTNTRNEKIPSWLHLHNLSLSLMPFQKTSLRKNEPHRASLSSYLIIVFLSFDWVRIDKPRGTYNIKRETTFAQHKLAHSIRNLSTS